MCFSKELGRYTVVVNKKNNMDVYPCSRFIVMQKKKSCKARFVVSHLLLLKKKKSLTIYLPMYL